MMMMMIEVCDYYLRVEDQANREVPVSQFETTKSIPALFCGCSRQDDRSVQGDPVPCATSSRCRVQCRDVPLPYEVTDLY
jgi:hypothetical protein